MFSHFLLEQTYGQTDGQSYNGTVSCATHCAE